MGFINQTFFDLLGDHEAAKLDFEMDRVRDAIQDQVDQAERMHHDLMQAQHDLWWQRERHHMDMMSELHTPMPMPHPSTVLSACWDVIKAIVGLGLLISPCIIAIKLLLKFVHP